jgi:hypothetical protein
VKKPKPNRVLYPWDEWFSIPDGCAESPLRILRKGKDFFTSMKNFRCRLFIAARRLGYHVKTHMRDSKTLELVAYRKTSALDLLESLSRGTGGLDKLPEVEVSPDLEKKIVALSQRMPKTS